MLIEHGDVDFFLNLMWKREAIPRRKKTRTPSELQEEDQKLPCCSTSLTSLLQWFDMYPLAMTWIISLSLIQLIHLLGFTKGARVCPWEDSKVHHVEWGVCDVFCRDAYENYAAVSNEKQTLGQIKENQEIIHSYISSTPSTGAVVAEGIRLIKMAAFSEWAKTLTSVCTGTSSCSLLFHLELIWADCCSAQLSGLTHITGQSRKLWRWHLERKSL